jgi:LPXTG-motif cell wall-anchored protein
MDSNPPPTPASVSNFLDSTTTPSPSLDTKNIVIIIGTIAGVGLIGLVLYRRRKNKKKEVQSTQLLEVVVDTHPRLITSFSSDTMYEIVPQPSLIMSNSFEYSTNNNIEINPIFDETKMMKNPLHYETEPDEFIFEPDKLENDDDVLQIIEFMVINDDFVSFDNIIEQVKGLPIYGRMLMISETKREEFIRKIKEKHQAPDEVVNVMSKLRKVHRNSISRSSTVITKMRAQMHWNKLFEKLLVTF